MSSFDEDFLARLKAYDELFVKFNKIHSLSTYKNIAEVAKDSLAILEFPEQFMDFSSAKVAIDIGSGAGFPAVFLAMKMNECLFHLFEPNAKKASFLSFLKAHLGLENIVVHSKKIENEQSFRADIITSRAAFKVAHLLALSKGFYDENTIFALFKGSSFEAELNGLEAQISVKKGAKRNYVFIKGVKC